MQPLIFRVTGIPGAQGSKKHVGRGIMVESSKKVKPWRSDVKGSAERAVDAFKAADLWGGPIDAAVEVTVVFRFLRPKGHYGTGRNAHVLKPSAPRWPTSKALGDADKLARSSLDALTEAGVFVDDSLVVDLRSVKRYCEPGEESGAAFRIRLMDDVGEVAA